MFYNKQKKLIKAINDKNYKTISKLLKNGASVVSVYKVHKSYHTSAPVELAIDNRDCVALSLILTEGFDIEDYENNPNRNDLLKYAVFSVKNSSTIKYSYFEDVSDMQLILLLILDLFPCLDSNASIWDCVDKNGNLDTKCCEVLIDYKINLNGSTLANQSPVVKIIMSKNHILFDKLIENDFNFFYETNFFSCFDKCTLDVAIRSGDEYIIKKLLDIYVYNNMNYRVERCLLDSIASANYDIFKLILDSGFNFETVKMDNLPIMKCMFNSFNGTNTFRYEKYVNYIIRKGSKRYIKEYLPSYYPQFLFKNDDIVSVYSIILSLGVSLNDTNELVINFDNDCFVINNNNINRSNDDGLNLLMLAVLNNNLNLIKLLLKTSIDLDLVAYNGKNVMDFAYIIKNEDVINLLSTRISSAPSTQLIRNDIFYALLDNISNLQNERENKKR